jgi:heme-degrading monooxygenase HmoA
MIARHWRGWTSPQNATAYQELLSGTVLPGLKKISGYRGGYVLRRDAAEEVEFVVVNLFDSIEAVQQFDRGAHFEDCSRRKSFTGHARRLPGRAGLERGDA